MLQMHCNGLLIIIHIRKTIVNQDSLNSLPLHGVPQDLLSVETENLENIETCEPDLGPKMKKT